MATAIVMELFLSKDLHAVQYWVTKADGCIQSIQWGAFVCLCYGKLQPHLLPQSQLTSTQRGNWSTEYTTAVPPHWILWPNLRTVFSHVIRCCPQHPFND